MFRSLPFELVNGYNIWFERKDSSKYQSLSFASLETSGHDITCKLSFDLLRRKILYVKANQMETITNKDCPLLRGQLCQTSYLK